MPFEPGNQESKKADHSKRRIITQHLVAVLQEGDSAKLRSVVKTLVDKATGGDMTAMGYILERVDGKVPQPHTGDDDGPIRLVIKWAPEQVAMPPGQAQARLLAEQSLGAAWEPPKIGKR